MPFSSLIAILIAILAARCIATHTSRADETSYSVPPVHLTNGLVIHGTVNTTASPNVAQYLGIPFAQPPVGSLRWEPPQPYIPSTDRFVNGTKLPKSCWQYISRIPSITGTDAPEFSIGDAGMSEDCLTVSIWTPSTAVGGGGQKSLPVLIWFHGGGLSIGGEDTQYLIPEEWVQRSGSHIVVSFNYRLNIFGFPNAAGLKEVNLGLMDQRLAVEWVRDNIAHFGGNPESITIWGQSAGAVSVDYYSFAWWEDPIVNGLIMDSGTAHLSQLTSLDVLHSNFSFVASSLGCGNRNSAATELACMRSVPASKIESFLGEYGDSGTQPSLAFTPLADGKLVFENYTEMSANGYISKLPAIIGFNEAEGLFLTPYSVDGPNKTTTSLAEALGYEYYFCPTTKTTYERLAANLTTYRYFYAGNFSNISPRPWEGAYHSSELPLIFGTHADFRGNSTPFEYRVSHALQDAWLEFARNPNRGLERLLWPAYEEEGGNVRKFAIDGAVAQTGDLKALEKECVVRNLL